MDFFETKKKENKEPIGKNIDNHNKLILIYHEKANISIFKLKTPKKYTTTFQPLIRNSNLRTILEEKLKGRWFQCITNSHGKNRSPLNFAHAPIANI
jgi:hypothetical protein